CVRGGGIKGDVRSACVGVLVEHFLERSCPIGRTEAPALLVRAVRMAEYRNEKPVRIASIDDDLRNLLAVAQPEVRPALAAVGGFIDAVAGGEVRALQPLAAPGIDDARIGGRDSDGADGTGRLIVEDGYPGAPEVR